MRCTRDLFGGPSLFPFEFSSYVLLFLPLFLSMIFHCFDLVLKFLCDFGITFLCFCKFAEYFGSVLRLKPQRSLLFRLCGSVKFHTAGHRHTLSDLDHHNRNSFGRPSLFPFEFSRYVLLSLPLFLFMGFCCFDSVLKLLCDFGISSPYFREFAEFPRSVLRLKP